MRRILILSCAIALGAVVAGCGDSDTTDTKDDSGVTVPTTAASEGVTVDVELTEMSITSSMTTFTAGVPYHFVVHNAGDVDHEFMVVEPIEAGTMDMEDMDAMALAHIEEDELGPGATQTLDVTFDKAYAPDEIEFACHIEDHYEKGMLLPVTVEE